MEPNAPSDQSIGFWLRDYTQFICDQFRLPYEQGEGLLQRYFHLTAGGPPQQPTSSFYGDPTGCPETPNACQYSHFQEQSPSAPVAPGQNLLLSDPGPSSWHHEPPMTKEASRSSKSAAITASNAAAHGLFPAYDQQPDNLIRDFSLPATGSPSMQSSGPSNQACIGSMADYDPHWVQHNNVDPTKVKNFLSRMKFDTLIIQGVIKIGDILTFQVSVHANGENIKTEAHLKIIVDSECKCRDNGYADLSVTLLSDPSRQYPIAKKCRGTNAMIEHLHNACNMTVISTTSQHIQVFRGQQALGNLWWVQRAFHLWRERKD